MPESTYIVTDNVHITNYVPTKDHYKTKKDVDITNDENGKFSTKNERYQAIFDKLKALDGDSSSISKKDISNAKSLIGTNGISNVLLDAESNVARFVFNDASCLRIDMGVNNNATLKGIQNEVLQGNATYDNSILSYLLQFITPHTPLKGDEIVLNKLPKGIKTLGDVKRYYKLPDGCLRNNVAKGGGDFDRYEAKAPVYIHVATLAKGLGVPEEQIEAIFNLK